MTDAKKSRERKVRFILYSIMIIPSLMAYVQEKNPYYFIGFPILVGVMFFIFRFVDWQYNQYYKENPHP